MEQIDAEMVSVHKLVTASYNARRLSANDHKHLTTSIKKFGLLLPIVVNKNKERENVVIGGHQRLRICKELKIEEVPVYYLDLSIQEEKELNIRLNKNKGDFDYNKLTEYFNAKELIGYGFEKAQVAFMNDLSEEVQAVRKESFDNIDYDSAKKTICVIGEHKVAVEMLDYLTIEDDIINTVGFNGDDIVQEFLKRFGLCK